ncbi:MAG: hypothetical protein M5U34_09695 [Chloroflexi bacterium]|nr:hypothetical protein [Chloroflexota bacterium]
MNKTVNTKAPLWARKEIIIEAPLENVWNLQTNIEGWPQWQSDITAAQLEGGLTVGLDLSLEGKGIENRVNVAYSGSAAPNRLDG